MATTRHPTKTTGVRYKLHPSRRHGVNYDKYFSIRYRNNEGAKEEGIGWSSEGWTEKKAAAVLAELKANITTGTGHQSLKEKKSIADDHRKKLDQEKRETAEEEAKSKKLTLDHIFLQYCEANSHKKSLKDEINYFKNWIAPAIGTKKLSEVILFDLERIRKKMMTAGNAPRSIQYIKSIIRQTYHYAHAHNLYFGESPTINFLKKERNDNRRQRYLSPQEAENLLNQVREYSEKTYQISLLSLHSGMRFGEIASLQWQHVNTKNREILVVDPKNGENRGVTMTDRIVEMFNQIPKGRPEEIVFSSANGSKRPRVSNVFAKAVDDLGFNDGITDRRMKVVFHSLRHSCASILVNAGVELPVIAKILGHKTLAMTMRYSHISNSSVKKAMAIFDEQKIESSTKILKLQKV